MSQPPQTGEYAPGDRIAGRWLPIRRIWSGERDEAALTGAINLNSALIVREVLRRLEA